MEKIKQSIRKKFPQVKLYLDDLTQIIEVLEAEHFKKIEIITPTHKYTVNEIDKINSKTDITEIKSYDPFYISIDFNNSFGEGVSIYTGIDSVLAEGMILKIGKILLTKKRKFFSIVSKSWIAYIVFTIIQLLAYFLLAKEVMNKLTMSLMILGTIVIYTFIILLDSGKLVRKNIFYYKSRRDQPSFWVRKKDEIIVGIITAIITVIITVIITKLFGRGRIITSANGVYLVMVRCGEPSPILLLSFAPSDICKRYTQVSES